MHRFHARVRKTVWLASILSKHVLLMTNLYNTGQFKFSTVTKSVEYINLYCYKYLDLITGSKYVMHNTSSAKGLVNSASIRGKTATLHLQTWNSNHTNQVPTENLFHPIARHILIESVPNKTATPTNHYT